MNELPRNVVVSNNSAAGDLIAFCLFQGIIIVLLFSVCYSGKFNKIGNNGYSLVE